MRGLLLALLLSACAGTVTVETQATVRPVEVMLSRTVLLNDPGCTGVRIGGGQVLTAKHCIAGEDSSLKVGDDYSGYTVSYIDHDHDFIVMVGDRPLDRIRLPNALIGERVYIVGYPQSIDDSEQHATVTDGIFTGVEYEGMQRVTAYAYYGNSGGGAWNEAGELVGILVEIRPVGVGQYGVVPMPAHSYMVPTRLIRGAL